MSILERQYKQDAVYWGNPQENGSGGFTFDDPIEIKCRWEDIKQVVTDKKGNEITSRAVVYVKQDLDEEGMIYLGTLDDLTSAMEIDPKTVENAFIIKRFAKIPSLQSSTEFVRAAYLTTSLSFGGF